jgi:hypothetical protein
VFGAEAAVLLVQEHVDEGRSYPIRHAAKLEMVVDALEEVETGTTSDVAYKSRAWKKVSEKWERRKGKLYERSVSTARSSNLAAIRPMSSRSVAGGEGALLLLPARRSRPSSSPPSPALPPPACPPPIPPVTLHSSV